MNKLMVYSFLLLLYLTLSKSLSPSEYGISYVNHEENLTKLVKGAPVTAILIDAHSTGFMIKTYYLKYKIIYGFQSYEELIVRTSSSFFRKNEPYIGLSTFRRSKNNLENFTPLPPGSIFIGDENFGKWVTKKTGETYWKFSRVYRQIPLYLGWGEFVPDKKLYDQIMLHMQKDQPFEDLQDLFGLKGKTTQENFPDYFERKNKYIMTWKDFLMNYFNENFINYKEKL